ncbi:DUF3560 domain-containing protein [Streptomyces roseolus]|uniref:DUF3560 domain-containing protein n=1 Tax=Streptomyces roseolus TaxID=67358 RepID=UPI00167979D0|nr:DUF3560 domain-containing protein [Streptomyces roseolus]GGR67493.1 hypothetical protein GCM10010282_70470 [Streptomyces roseolus]
MTRYIDTKHVSAELRRRLKKEFPGVKFSVRTGTGTGSAWISVRWTDGPDTKAVDKVKAPLHGAHWDGYSETYVATGNVLTVTVEGEQITGEPLVNGINTHRDFSEDVLAEAKALWSAAFDGADPDDGGMRGSVVVGGKVVPDTWAPNQVRYIAQEVVAPKRWEAALAAAKAPAEAARPRRKTSATAGASDGITVTCTAEEGVTVTGTAFGDGAAPILRAHGLDWSRKRACWYVKDSRGDQSGAALLTAHAAAEALRAAGLTVTADLPELPAGTALPAAPAAAPVEDPEEDDLPEEFSGIVLRHTRAGGTLAEGTSRGDGSAEILKGHRFRWLRNLGSWYLPHSRDKAADRFTLDAVSKALQEAGHAVHITVREDIARSFTEAEAEREERAADRAERFKEYASRAAGASSAAFAKARQIGSGIPMGQPILIGHHSERRHRRDLARIEANQRKGIDEGNRAEYYAGRADAAANYERHRQDPARTLRRLKELEATLRGLEKLLAGESAFGSSRDISKPETIAELTRRHTETADEIAHWWKVIEQAEADGVKLWSRADFTKGDYVRSRGRWYEVLRVNAASLTVPGGPDIQPVINQDTRAYSWNDRIPYDDVTGRMSAADMTARLAAAN